MKNSFWKAVSFILAGIIIGLIGADKLSMGVETIFKGTVKFRQKGRGNIQDVTIKPEIVQKPRKAERLVAKLERQQQKAANKSARKEKRGKS